MLKKRIIFPHEPPQVHPALMATAVIRASKDNSYDIEYNRWGSAYQPNTKVQCAIARALQALLTACKAAALCVWLA